MQLPDRLPNAVLIQDICHTVVTAARYVPGANCLAQSITGRAMLRRAGCVAEIRIGVLKNLSELQAHAWLESGGSVLIGGPVTRYTHLTDSSHAPEKA